MSTEIDDDAPKPEAMFTRAQMAREVARQVREKVDAKLAEYGNLDELRAKAAEAEKNKSQLDRIEQQLAAQTERAGKLERENLVRTVADKLGISERLVRKLDGKTEAEMLSEARELIEDLGIRPKGKATSDTAEKDGDAEPGGNAEQDDQQDETPPAREQPRRTRPREQLQSGAPRTPTEPDETDPMKLVAAIPRR